MTALLGFAVPRVTLCAQPAGWRPCKVERAGGAVAAAPQPLAPCRTTALLHSAFPSVAYSLWQPRTPCKGNGLVRKGPGEV